MVKNLLAHVGDVRDAGLTPVSGRSSGGGHGNPLQYSCLGNPMDIGQSIELPWVGQDWSNLVTKLLSYAHIVIKSVHSQ